MKLAAASANRSLCMRVSLGSSRSGQWAAYSRTFKRARVRPHPVASLRAGAELAEGRLVDTLLGVEESQKIEGIAHAGSLGLWRPAGKGARALLVRREAPGHDIEENHHRDSQQRQ